MELISTFSETLALSSHFDSVKSAIDTSTPFPRDEAALILLKCNFSFEFRQYSSFQYCDKPQRSRMHTNGYEFINNLENFVACLDDDIKYNSIKCSTAFGYLHLNGKLFALPSN